MVKKDLLFNLSPNDLLLLREAALLQIETVPTGPKSKGERKDFKNQTARARKKIKEIDKILKLRS